MLDGYVYKLEISDGAYIVTGNVHWLDGELIGDGAHHHVVGRLDLDMPHNLGYIQQQYLIADVEFPIGLGPRFTIEAVELKEDGALLQVRTGTSGKLSIASFEVLRKKNIASLWCLPPC